MDEEIRTLERQNRISGDAAEQLLAARLRVGQARRMTQGFVDLLTKEGALWLAGSPYLQWHGETALQQYLVEEGLPIEVAREAVYDDRVLEAVFLGCRLRAQAEWDPISAIAVLGPRYRVRLAFDLDRMPDGTTEEEIRLREHPPSPYDVDYVLRDGGIRPRRRPRKRPFPMGWEDLIHRRYQTERSSGE